MLYILKFLPYLKVQKLTVYILHQTFTFVNRQYKKQLKNKDDEIKQSNAELNNFKAIVTNFLIRLNGLKLIDFIFRRKHEEMIKELQDSIWITSEEVEILENQKNSNNSINGSPEMNNE